MSQLFSGDLISPSTISDDKVLLSLTLTHCKWLNNCIGKKNYTTFFLMIFVLLMVFLMALTAYSSAALGQVFFFHVLLIRKGIRTYDYILEMREENDAMELESFDDFDLSSDDNIDFDSPEKLTLMSRILCKGQSSPRLSIKIERDIKPYHLYKKFQGLAYSTAVTVVLI